MKVRSMTAFAQVTGQVNDQLSFTLALKSVNHRFLDLHLRLPSDSDGLEMKIRRFMKEKLSRGHVDVTLSVQRGSGGTMSLNRELVGGYVGAFRAAATDFGVTGEPDLNAIFRIPGALETAAVPQDESFDTSVMDKLDEAIERLNTMRAQEGAAIEQELRSTLDRLQAATCEIEKLRVDVLRAYMEKINSRLRELLEARYEPERIMQEAALLAERSDIQEELVRMHTHIRQFRAMLDSGGDIGKKLDFLSQEMNREANTMLSKTSGVTGDALRITELGLSLKSEIEKIREQVQNVE